MIWHLTVFLNTERVLLVSTDSESHFVHRDHSISRGSLKHMQFCHARLRSSHNFELTQAHLKHHVWPKMHLRSHHNESSSCWANISQEKVSQIAICQSLIFARQQGPFIIFDLTMTSTYKTLRNDHIVGGGVSSQSSPIVPNNVYIVQKLPFDSLQNKNVTLRHFLTQLLISSQLLQILLWCCYKFSPATTHRIVWIIRLKCVSCSAMWIDKNMHSSSTFLTRIQIILTPISLISIWLTCSNSRCLILKVVIVIWRISS